MTTAEIKARLDIVDVIGHYVKLRRRGSASRHVGLCAFHSEKTPSLTVDGERQSYRCFGCDAAGDVFTFVQQIESLTFPETLRLLAERYGIAMDSQTRSAPARPKLTEREFSEAEQFIAALAKHTERLLEEAKESMWQAFEDGLPLEDDAPLYSAPVRELTTFVTELQRWTRYRAVETLRHFRRSQPAFTASLMAQSEADRQALRILVANYVAGLAPMERAA